MPACRSCRWDRVPPIRSRKISIRRRLFAGRHLGTLRRPRRPIQRSSFTGAEPEAGVVIATWADYKKAGPLLFSLDHRGTADGKPLRVFFSNVAVKLAGWNSWIDAQ